MVVRSKRGTSVDRVDHVIQDAEWVGVHSRPDKSGKKWVVSFQWHDGAGELHFESLSPELSREYAECLAEA
jgi:hypothetical protein